MKAKNIILSGFLMAGALCMSSCSLEEYNPSGGPTVEEFLSTPEGFEQFINSCYYPLTRSWTGGGEDYVVFTAEVGTDLWTCPQGKNYIKELFYYEGLNGAIGHLNEGWQASYEAINYCNAAVHYVANAGYTDAAVRDAKVAEAHFLRAFFNFYLVEQFGGVYLPTVETNSPMIEIPRSSVSAFYSLIFSDLKFAMQHLPKSQTEIGRATRAAAYHLYAKACLQYAGYDEATDKKTLYENARDAALEVINNQASYGVAMYNEIAETFDVKNNKSNKEALWVATHSKSSTLNPRGDKYWNRVYKQFGCLAEDGQLGVSWSYDNYIKGDQRIMPTRALLDMYGAKDMRYDAFFREEYIAQKNSTWKEGDVQKFGKPTSMTGQVINAGDRAMFFTRQDIADPASLPYACLDRDMLYNADGTVNTKYTMYGYPAFKKFDAPGMYAGELKKNYSWSDQIMYRLAETYLLAGEALYRLNDDRAETYFNTVRNRACKDHDGSMDISNSDINVDFILAERGRELCGEYTRWMDLKRMGKATMEKYIKSNPDIGKNGSFNVNVHYLRPIPEKSELNYQKNPKDFQNPGY